PAWEYFSYIQLGDWIDVHPAYFSMYLIFCCALLLHDMHEDKRVKPLNMALIAISILFIALLSSRIAIISLVLIMVYLLHGMFKTKAIRFAFAVACLLVLSFMVLINPVSRYRVFQEPLLTPF